jgi:transcriptional regulator with XRE-family HTH domain
MKYIPISHEPRFSDNLSRLCGMHKLSGKDAAKVLETDPATFSQWLNSRRQPSLNLILRLSEVFEVSPDRLMKCEFSELVENELGDPARFERVEKKIRKSSHPVRAVQ